MQKQGTGSKEEVGMRFRQFRMIIHKAQHELAAELNISQSTIANIEGGKAFPNLSYIHYFYYKYRLDSNWLLTGQGDIFRVVNETPAKYTELIDLMQAPFIAQVIMAKLVEAKVLFKDCIAEYFEKEEKEETGYR